MHGDRALPVSSGDRVAPSATASMSSMPTAPASAVWRRTGSPSGGPGFAQPLSPDGKSIPFVACPSSSAPVTLQGRRRGRRRRDGSSSGEPSSWWSYNPTWIGGKIVSLVIKGFHASPFVEQIQASAYIVNRDGTGLRLLYPNLGDALEIAWGSAPLPRVGCPAG